MPKDGNGLKIKGSVMLALAESKEEVIKALQEDVYYKSGIWNWDRVQIHPVSRIGRWSFNSGVLIKIVQICGQATSVICPQYLALLGIQVYGALI